MTLDETIPYEPQDQEGVESRVPESATVRDSPNSIKVAVALLGLHGGVSIMLVLILTTTMPDLGPETIYVLAASAFISASLIRFVVSKNNVMQWMGRIGVPLLAILWFKMWAIGSMFALLGFAGALSVKAAAAAFILLLSILFVSLAVAAIAIWKESSKAWLLGKQQKT